MLKALIAGIGLIAFAHLAVGDDRGKLVGVWKLVSWESEFQDGSGRRPVMGKATGYLILTAEGRMMAVLEAEGRKPAQTDEQRAALWRTTVGYTGIYRVEGDKWITTVDVSWNPAWHGSEQVRFFKLEGDRLQVSTDWGRHPTLPGGPTTRGVLMWERTK